MPEQTRYLFCETATATLHGFQEDVVELPSTRGLEASLFNSSGTKIGTLDLVNEESRDRFPMHAEASEAGLSVDVVAVCKLKTYSKREIPGNISFGNSQTEDTYLVLWVEWEDGIAYRVASGEVIAEEWEKLDLKTVSLVLG
jgi:hypothetical protein